MERPTVGEPTGAAEPAEPAGQAEQDGPPGLAGRAASPGSLPLLPGFREMALRRMSDDRRRLVADLAAERQAAGLSQTEVAARMGTSQSAVARLEAGTADVRASTLERYAAAIGGQITWRLQAGGQAAGTVPGPGAGAGILPAGSGRSHDDGAVH